MNVAYLLTGGNTGDRLQYLHTAAEAIKKHCGSIVKRSSIYETAAWGIKEQNIFLNQALKLSTTLSSFELLDCILEIELSMGRIRQEKYGPRIIDIDILLFNDDIIDSRSLKVPHPELANRRFALQCLADIAPKKIHPVYKKTIAQILKECTDPLEVDKFK
jgi:2-amino-4-hydroxy-6-hydroxymethyldihydropteridine diphosphokinase